MDVVAVVTTDLKKGHTAVTHGWFHHIRQVAPMWPPSNTYLHVPTQVHIPNDHFSHFFHRSLQKVSMFYNGLLLFPQNFPCTWGNLDPLSNTRFLGSPHSSSQTTSWLVQPFLQVLRSWQTERDRPRYSVCKIGVIYVQLWSGQCCARYFSKVSWRYEIKIAWKSILKILR